MSKELNRTTALLDDKVLKILKQLKLNYNKNSVNEVIVVLLKKAREWKK